MELSGPPVALYDGLASNPFAAGVALSDAGTLVYQTASRASSRELVWVSRTGLATLVDSTWKPDGTVGAMALSPNGHSIALDLSRGGKGDIWVKQLPAGPFSRITFGDTTFARPAWNHDGSQLIYLGDRGDALGIPFSKRADGVGSATRLSSATLGFGAVSQSPDGQWLVLMRLDSDSPDIMGLHAGDTTFVPLVATPASETGPQLSPDGKWLAYASDESGTFEIYVRPFPSVASARWQISTSGGTSPLWAHSGKELFFHTKQGDVASVPVSTTSGFSVGTPRVLFSAKPFRFSPQTLTYNISPDDKQFLMMRETATGEAGQLIVSEHWLDDIESRRQ